MKAVLIRATSLALMGLFILSCSRTTDLNDDVDAKISINYEKFQLTNGLTVILHKDNSDPLVHVDVTYHVGSAREFPGRSGFAHFFEHMMFQGSEHVADEQHFKLVTQAGGDLNGTTNSDRTNYYETVPSNQLERMLWLESDRMGFLLEAVTQEKFEVQRETVKNERAQRIDNQPYGLSSEKTAQALYPPSHPYSWPTIGYIEDLEQMNLADLKRFFLRWYGPNNAVLTIGGDFDSEQTKAWINKYFGDIPRGPEVSKASVMPVVLERSRYITLEDTIHLPMLQTTLPTVYARHPDEAALDILADILGGGKTSLLYKNLVKSGDAVQAVVSHPCKELACEFQIIALANPEQIPNLHILQQKINDTLHEFETRGVLDDDLERTKASIETATVFGLQSVAGKVSILAANETFYGNPDLVAQDIARYNRVTAADVMRVYKKYIKNKPSVVLSVVPKGKLELAAKPQNYTVPPRITANADLPAIAERSTVSTFDRNIIPPAGNAPIVKVPEFWQTQLANNVNVFGIESHDTPTINISITFEGGILLDPIDKAGLASVTAQLMNESTTLNSNEELANQLAKLGSSVSFWSGGRYTTINVSSLRKNIFPTLLLVKEKLFNPAFLDEEFIRVKKRIIQNKIQQRNNPDALAFQATSTILFGVNNRVSLPGDGTISTLNTITLDDVKAFYKRYYTSSKASVVVVGDIPKHTVMNQLGFLNKLSAKDYTIPSYSPFPQYSQQSIYLVDKPSAVQSVVRLVTRSNVYDAFGVQFKSRLMNFPLGSAFNSRINLNLREEKSITYGASSYFVGGKSLGWYEVSTDVVQDSTAIAISEILEEIRTFKEQGITDEELKFMQSAFTQSDALDYETPGSKANFLRRMSAYDLPSNYKEQQLSIIKHITMEQINDIAEQELHPDAMQIIVVGDAKALTQQLEALALPIVPLQLIE